MTDVKDVAGGQGIQDETHGPTRSTEQYPPAPNPSADPGVVPKINAAQNIKDDQAVPEADFQVDDMEPLVALKMLSRGIQVLSEMTGDVPATPPISRSNSPRIFEPQSTRSRTGSRPPTPPSRVPSGDIAALKSMPIGSPEAHALEPASISDILELKAQYDTIARKFYSKKPPPISIYEYLLRLHRYCPMSTAVYLAACVYIHRLAVEDKSVPVTIRTAHRLLLASLRIAMKALEDLNYPHKRFAGVGGVSERELAKLEVALCYMLNFDLRVDGTVLHDKARAFQQLATATSRASGTALHLKLPTRTHLPRQPDSAQASAG